MTATAGRLTAAGPRPKELWLTVGLSILVHGLLLLAIVMVPRFRFGTYVTVPVSYTVDLVSATPGGRAGASAPAKAPSVAAARPAPPAPAPAPAPRAAPAPPPPPAARSSEELTLPGKRPPQKAPPEVEPSLRLPSVAGREKQRPAPADLRPRPPVAVQAPPGPAAPAAPPVASAGPVGPPAGSAETASGKASGLELASGDRGEGSGGSALGYYLGLVDYKISTHWNPVATGGARDSVAVVRFRVLRSGNVRDVELETSSGDAGLDAAAMRAIRQSLPLPPFPNLLTEPFLNLRYRFVVERG
jgi:TonB family protein